MPQPKTWGDSSSLFASLREGANGGNLKLKIKKEVRHYDGFE
jgi:hypothetical protein